MCPQSNNSGFDGHCEELFSRGIRITASLSDLLREPIQIRMGAQLGLRQRQNLRARPRFAAIRSIGAVVGLDRLDQFADPYALRRNEFQDRCHRLTAQVPHRLVCALAVCLVHDHDVGNFQ
jgi:hypothetical protein